MTDCEGCYTEDTCAYIIYSEMCPCIMCLIKMVCKKSCQERFDFRLRLDKEENDKIGYAGDIGEYV